jgi:hypothetical protein
MRPRLVTHSTEPGYRFRGWPGRIGIVQIDVVGRLREVPALAATGLCGAELLQLEQNNTIRVTRRL